MTSKELLNHLYYRLLPSVYREEDRKIGMHLYRYFDSLVTGGMSDILNSSEKLVGLIDPFKCPDSLFPEFYRSFGLGYYPDIEMTYQRKFLSNVGEIVRRRGTPSSVRYLVRVLTGLEVDLSYMRGYNEDVMGRHLFIALIAKTLEQLEEMEYSIRVVEDFIQTQVPFYITPHVFTKISVAIVPTKITRACVLTQALNYNLNWGL